MPLQPFPVKNDSIHEYWIRDILGVRLHGLETRLSDIEELEDSGQSSIDAEINSARRDLRKLEVLRHIVTPNCITKETKNALFEQLDLIQKEYGDDHLRGDPAYTIGNIVDFIKKDVNKKDICIGIAYPSNLNVADLLAV